MNNKGYDAILSRLEADRNRKKDIQLAKAKAEVETICREADAYFDGVYDAIKAIKEADTQEPTTL